MLGSQSTLTSAIAGFAIEPFSSGIRQEGLEQDARIIRIRAPRLRFIRVSLWRNDVGLLYTLSALFQSFGSGQTGECTIGPAYPSSIISVHLSASSFCFRALKPASSSIQ